MVSIQATIPLDHAAVLLRAIMRVEAELLLADADKAPPRLSRARRSNAVRTPSSLWHYGWRMLSAAPIPECLPTVDLLARLSRATGAGLRITAPGIADVALDPVA